MLVAERLSADTHIMGGIEDKIAAAAQVFIASAIERSDSQHPLHLAEIFRAAGQGSNAVRWMKEVHELIRTDGRLNQVGNVFKVVPGVDPSAPPRDIPAINGRATAAPVPTSSPPAVPAPSSHYSPAHVTPAAPSTASTPPLLHASPAPATNPSSVPAAVSPAPATTSTSPPNPTTSNRDPVPDESALLPFLASSKAIRVGSVSTMGQFQTLLERFHDTFSPAHADVAASVILERLEFLELVRIESVDVSSRKLVWDMHALGKHAAPVPSTAATTPSSGWTTAMLDRDLPLVKKSVLHQLRLFACYRLQNIHHMMQSKYPPPQSFQLDSYVDHIVHEIEEDKRLVITHDDSGNPAFTWAEPAKAQALLKDPLVPNNRHALEAAAVAAAATAAAVLEHQDTVATSSVVKPGAVTDSSAVWMDAVVAALWNEHRMRVHVQGDVLCRTTDDLSKKRPRASPERRSPTWDTSPALPTTDDQDTEDESSQLPAHKKTRRLHEVRQPVIEWSTPPQFQLPANVPVRPYVVESTEHNWQTQRARFLTSNVEVPYQQAPDLPTKPIALDYQYVQG
ncbi:hypothetical protein DYB38_002969 [Aphanomyces astaci]|uniref:Uncharacterized protein n=2 Tax=Aphanomyces astaci TaxID=112090 RepID=A0A397CBD4_APHAT|nr:hypothetical protein DYB38_002969 [Aphanomyces astaci]